MPDLLPPHLQKTVDAVLALVNSRSLVESHTILVREQDLLLTEPAARALELLIQQEQQGSDSSKEAREGMLITYQTILADARRYGVEKAWQAFEAFQRLTNRLPPSSVLAPPGHA